ncbi:hypothetical protein EJB05_48541, partial [Eragrostis curvula]
MTERYKVVHLPCYFDKSGGFNVVQVFTLGADASSWRDVPVPAGTSCCLAAGIIGIDGATYWVTNEGSESVVVSFELREERVRFTKALPAHAAETTWHLTEVHGRLGAVSSSAVKRRCRLPEKMDVWVLGDGDNKDRQGWSWRYRVEMSGVEDYNIWIARPHFVHRDYVLLTDRKQVVCRHRMVSAGRSRSSGEVVPVRLSVQTPHVVLATSFT